eukprot:FR743030.1.p1 GENE.FR743030.1~~FR743030.1.p1  ORF type:complete len:325 (+),score=52.28 FR743030.1:103-975(+)
MPWEDMQSHFSSVSLCLNKCSAGEAWHETDARGTLNAVPSDTPGGRWGAMCSSHYRLTVTSETEVMVTLSQDDPRVVGADELIDIAATVINADTLDVAAYAWLDTERQVCSVNLATMTKTDEMLKLGAGSYVIVPWSSGSRLSAVEPGALANTEWDQATVTAAARKIHQRYSTIEDQHHMLVEEIDKFLVDTKQEIDVQYKYHVQQFLEGAGQTGRSGVTVSGLVSWLGSGVDWRTVLETQGFSPGPSNTAIVSSDKRNVVLSLHTSQPVQWEMIECTPKFPELGGGICP